MARGPSHLGIDLNSIALAGVVLHERASSRGTEFVIEQSWADEIGAIAHIGGTWLLPPVWPEALRVSTAATILGILDASESVTLAAMDYSDGREAVRQANNLAEQIQNVSKDTGFTVPVPRAVDHRWGYLQNRLDVANVLQVAEWAQRVAPGRHPLLDVPVVAFMRALHVLQPEQGNDLVAFVHVDLWRTYVVLRQAATDRQLVVERQGIAHIAAQVAGERRQPFATTLRSLLAGQGWDATALAALGRIVETPTIKARRKMESVDQDRRADTLGLARSTVTQVRRVLLSGPLADLPGLEDTLRTVTRCADVAMWRPAASLRGASTDLKAHAGRYTIALGHALNERGFRRPERLPLDYTLRIPTAALAADQRDPGTIVAQDERRGRQRGQSARIVAPVSPERERQLKFAAGTLYLGVAVTLAAGLVYPRVQQGMLTRENGALASDTLALASDMLNLRNLQDETNLMVAKRSALAQLEAARTDGARVFAATSRAISRSQVEVWLTQLKSISRLEVEYEGSGRSPTAIASFLEGLRADTAVRGVALRKMTRHPKEGTWSFLAKVLLAPPQAVAPPAVPSTSPAPLGGPAAPAPGSTR